MSVRLLRKSPRPRQRAIDQRPRRRAGDGEIGDAIIGVGGVGSRDAIAKRNPGHAAPGMPGERGGDGLEGYAKSALLQYVLFIIR